MVEMGGMRSEKVYRVPFGVPSSLFSFGGPRLCNRKNRPHQSAPQPNTDLDALRSSCASVSAV
jgi:hypothetical protein